MGPIYLYIAQPRQISMKAAYFCVFQLQQLVLALDKFAEMRPFFLKGNVFRLDDSVFRLD
jgi:hypothetical protein